MFQYGVLEVSSSNSTPFISMLALSGFPYDLCSGIYVRDNDGQLLVIF